MNISSVFGTLICLAWLIQGCGGAEDEPSESFTPQSNAEEEVSSEERDREDTARDEEDILVVDSAELSPRDFKAKGPYQAGFRQFSLTYDLPGLDEPRTIEVGVWYPTEDTDGEKILWGDIWEEEDLFVNASLLQLPEGEKFPVRAYTHGNAGLMSDSSNTSEFFASHGWVTIAPNHMGNTMFDFMDPRPPWMFYARPRDMTEALDFMTNLDSEDPLSGKMNLDEIVLMGHSYGGYTGYGLVGAAYDYEGIESACNGGEGPLSGPCTPDQLAEFSKSVQDPRFVAYAPLDGGNPNMYGAAGVESVDVPMLQMYAIEPDGGGPHKGSETFWGWMQDKSIVRVGIQDGCHIGFTLGFCPGISDEEGYLIIHSYLMAFSQHVIQGAMSEDIKSVMLGDSLVSESVVFEITESAKDYWSEQ